MDTTGRTMDEDRISIASRAVSQVPKGDFVEIKAFNNPPVGVKDVLTASMLLLGHKESEVNWSMIKKYLGKVGEESLQQRVLNNDYDKIPRENITKAKAILDKYDAATVAKISMAAKALYVWAEAVTDS